MRRTLRLTARLLAIGLALGRAAGARLSQSLAILVNRNTLLRVIRRAPCPVIISPQVLSVDDVALRKRHTYGTLPLDLGRRPLALLPDWETTTVTPWLQAHPGVEVLVRDCAEANAEAARTRAPEALQVADRFHLLQNLVDVLTDVFRTHASQLARVSAERTNAPTPVLDPAYPATVPSIAATRWAQRMAHYQQGWMFHRQGWTLDAIAHQVGLSRRTVQRCLQSSTLPEPQPWHGRGRSLLDPYKATLLAGWKSGCRNGSHLFPTIRSQGFRGHYGLVGLYVRRMRQAQGLIPWQRCSHQPLPAVTEAPRRPLTPRRVTWLVLRPSA